MPKLNGAPLDCGAALERWGAMVFRLAWHTLGCREDAEDAAQEVFVSLVQSKSTFRDEEHLQRWLVRCTIHRCRNLSLSAWRRHTVPLPERWDVPAYGSDPMDQSVSEAVGRLPTPYRQAVCLHYVEGYTALEIGRLLGCPRGTVLSRLSRARTLLRTYLKEEVL
ncbi:sigma-70 family RNA polymerase sigma factor [Pseudoflavonifractor phocaeensis]|uniref:RNA polymerase sigma factor n=1 Tax=Pseudoflavonifractor phocaeensis TaxID=1870988 RepID=UPI0019566204|nr:sigma-70 family RNA polymerase sigma factor [Pseudoflavonifractor phocaeensis]MBM6938428.1 sigma-70 family RNA polymerase sigma factor [Pseudoflavonifractor phocaeensis]